MPPTGQLVCPAHPMQKPHLRAGMIFSSTAIDGLSSSSSSSTFMKGGGVCVTAGAVHWGACTVGRAENIQAELTARIAKSIVMIERMASSCGGGSGPARR